MNNDYYWLSYIQVITGRSKVIRKILQTVCNLLWNWQLDSETVLSGEIYGDDCELWQETDYFKI